MAIIKKSVSQSKKATAVSKSKTTTIGKSTLTTTATKKTITTSTPATSTKTTTSAPVEEKKVTTPVETKTEVKVEAKAPVVSAVNSVEEYSKFNTFIFNTAKKMIDSKPGFTRNMVKIVGSETVKVQIKSTKSGVYVKYTVNNNTKIDKEFDSESKLKEAFDKL